MQVIDLREPRGKYGESFQAMASILKVLGETETQRQDKILQENVLSAIMTGQGESGVMAAISQQPQYSTGVSGILQKIASPFATEPPTKTAVTSMSLQQLYGDPYGVKKAQAGAYKALAESRRRPKPTKMQELVKEGYSPDEARMIRDISHGLKPRASARKRYGSMGDVEKLDFLSTLKQRAEGQYFGIDPELGSIAEPRQPKLLKWVNEEMAKLPILKAGVSQELSNMPEPQIGDAVIYDRETRKPTRWLGPEGLTKTKSQVAELQEYAAKLDPASKAQLEQIITEGDTAKIAEALKRLREKYGTLR